MIASLAAIVLASSIAAGQNPGWPTTMDALRKAWRLEPVDEARRGVWQSRMLSSGAQRILVGTDSAKDGSVRSLEWTAETGVRAHDIPDDAFWAILDGTSNDAEWTETDPDALPKAFLKGMRESASQGFLCRSCKPRLAAATFTRHGATGLRLAPLGQAAPAVAVGLANGVTENGLRSLAAQRKLSVDVANPCADKAGVCGMELSGSDGQKWSFSRRDGKSAWDRLEASYQAGAWWSPEWDWDSVRIHAPREFQTVIGAWVGSEADVLAEKLLAPIEPILAFPVSSWKARELAGMRVQQLSDSVAKLPNPPASLLLARSDRLEVRIDEFGRRIVRIGEPSR